MSNYYSKIAKRVSKIKHLFKSKPNNFLSDISGVVHVGANAGQERDLYDKYGLAVIWIEPIPDIYEQLKDNIKEYKNQRAFKALITDVNDRKYDFHIANNNGASSSIYDLKYHKDIWPEVNYQKTVTMNSVTLTSLFKNESIDATKYQALIMDTQGSEMLVLKGSVPLLENFKYIKTEVADFESYDGCCQLHEMIEFMTEHGFKEHDRTKFSQRAQGGSYYDITFKKSVNR